MDAASLIAWGTDDANQVTNVPVGDMWRDIDAYGPQGAAVDGAGDVYTWGDVTVPDLIGFDAVRVSISDIVGVVQRSDGSLYAWPAPIALAIEVMAGTSHRNDWIDFMAAGDNVYAIDGDGEVHVFGDNTHGQKTSRPPTKGWARIACASDFAIAVHSDTTLYTWGSNTNNQVTLTPTSAGWKIPACFGSAGVCLRHDGTVEAWGTSTPASLPSLGGTLGGWTDHVSGMLRRDDGTFWVYGPNNNNVVTGSPSLFGQANGFVLIARTGTQSGTLFVGRWCLVANGYSDPVRFVGNTSSESGAISSGVAAPTFASTTRTRAKLLPDDTWTGRPDRRPAMVYRIETETCSRVYGVGPCAAVLGTTGDHKCFNTRKTCQDLANFNRADTSDLWFCVPESEPPTSQPFLPFLLSASTQPSKTNPGGTDPNVLALGMRARLSASLLDPPYGDRLLDPYVEERISGAAQADGIGYDPFTRGTFWTKFKARHNYEFYPIRVYTGYLDEPLENWQSRFFVLDAIKGPSGGTVSHTGRDPIALCDRAVWPPQSVGMLGRFVGGFVGFDDPAVPRFNRSIAIWIKVGALHPDPAVEIDMIVDQYRQPAGLRAAVSFFDPSETPPGIVRINDELILFRRLGFHREQRLHPPTGTWYWELYLYDCFRGYRGTDWKEPSEDPTHPAAYLKHTNVEQSEDGLGDRVQLCYWVENVTAPAVYESLFTSAGLPSEVWSRADWETSANHYASEAKLWHIASEPTSVKAVISQLAEQSLLFPTWDETETRITLLALLGATAAREEATETLDDDGSFIAGSFEHADKLEERYNWISVFYRQRTPLLAVKESVGYELSSEIVDTDSVSAFGIRRKNIFGNWIFYPAHAQQLASRLADRVAATPVDVGFALDAKDRRFGVGDFVRIRTRHMTDAIGLPLIFVCEIISRKETRFGHRYEYEGRIITTAT